MHLWGGYPPARHVPVVPASSQLVFPKAAENKGCHALRVCAEVSGEKHGRNK